MGHRFDSGLALPQRTVIRRAIVASLDELRVATQPGRGVLYLQALVELAAPVRFSQDEAEVHFQSALGLASPAVAVALGGRDFAAHGTDNVEWHGDLEVHVYCYSANSRGHLARLAGDVASGESRGKDPGIETIAEHVFERLAGAPLTAGHAAILRPLREDLAYLGADAVVIEQVYRVEVSTDVNPRRALHTLVDAIDTTHTDIDHPIAAGTPDALTPLESP